MTKIITTDNLGSEFDISLPNKVSLNIDNDTIFRDEDGVLKSNAPEYSVVTTEEDGLASSIIKQSIDLLYVSMLSEAITVVYSTEVIIDSDAVPYEYSFDGFNWQPVKDSQIPANTPVHLRVIGTNPIIDSLPGRESITEIQFWGDKITQLSLIGGAQLVSVPDKLPKNVTNLSSMFEGCPLFNQDISTWTVGTNITDMSSMFKDCSVFNQDLSSWNGTSALHTDFALGAGFEDSPEKHPLWIPHTIEFEVWKEGLPPKYIATEFAEGDTFYERDGLWFYVAPITDDESQLTELRNIVELYTDLEGDFPTADITDKNGVTKSIPLNQIVMTFVSYTYRSDTIRLMGTLGNSNFNQYIGSWDMTNFGNAYDFLRGCSSFNQPLNLELPNCTDASYFLVGCESFNQPLDINLPNCTDASFFLVGCISFNQPLDINLPKCTNASGFLADCISFNQPLTINLPNCIEATEFLSGCSSFNQPLTINLTNCAEASHFLYGCSSFNQPLAINLPSCTYAVGFLSDCSSFNQPLDINLPSCIEAIGFIQNCSSFDKPLNIDLPNCTDVGGFLALCSSFNQPLDINLPSCTYAGGFLFGCSSFDQDISNACVPKLTSAPEEWNTGTPLSFQNDISKHPVWGTCPSN